MKQTVDLIQFIGETWTLERKGDKVELSIRATIPRPGLRAESGEANAESMMNCPHCSKRIPGMTGLQEAHDKLLAACKDGLQYALAAGRDCDPRFQQERGEDPNFDAACDMAERFRVAIKAAIAAAESEGA